MENIVKVDRPASVDEALALEAAGATVIGVNLAPDPRFEDGRFVSVRVGQNIRAHLTTARLCAIIDAQAPSSEAALEAALALRPHWLQVPRYGAARAEWQEAILAAGLPVVLDGENASYEDDPGWIRAALDDAAAWGASLIQLDLLSDIADPWRFLQETAPQDPNELLQADEIAALTESYPLLIAMDVPPEQARALRSSFPASRGVFLRLTSPEIGSALQFLATLAV